jgi:hypothetical protein
MFVYIFCLFHVRCPVHRGLLDFNATEMYKSQNTVSLFIVHSFLYYSYLCVYVWRDCRHMETEPAFIAWDKSEYLRHPFFLGSRDSAVGIVTGYGLHDRGVRVRVPVASSIFFSPRCLDRLWGPPSLISNGYRSLFPRG